MNMVYQGSFIEVQCDIGADDAKYVPYLTGWIYFTILFGYELEVCMRLFLITFNYENSKKL